MAGDVVKIAIESMERPKTATDGGETNKKVEMARDVGIEPTRPFDHRLSRPAPYQAWGIPH